MDAATLIARLKVQCPGLHTVDEAFGQTDAAERALRRPAAFVLLLSEASEPNTLLGAHEQLVTATWGVVLTIQGVRSASTSLNAELDTLRRQVLAALAGWSAESDFVSPMAHVAGQLLSTDDGVVWWQDAFSCTFERRTL